MTNMRSEMTPSLSWTEATRNLTAQLGAVQSRTTILRAEIEQRLNNLRLLQAEIKSHGERIRSARKSG